MFIPLSLYPFIPLCVYPFVPLPVILLFFPFKRLFLYSFNPLFLDSFIPLFLYSFVPSFLRTIFLDSFIHLSNGLEILVGDNALSNTNVENSIECLISFLRSGETLGMAVNNMRDDYDLSDPDLKAEVGSLRSGNIDDSLCETPHSAFSRLHNGAPNSKFVWKACTLRLNQNLADANDLPPAINVSLQECWDNWKSILQVGQIHRNVRQPRSTFLENVYTLTSKFTPEAGGASAYDPFPSPPSCYSYIYKNNNVKHVTSENTVGIMYANSIH